MPVRLTYANVMATFAVFLALGGSAYGALVLPRNSVGTKQLRNGAVTHRKLRARSVSGADVRRNTLTGRNIDAATLGQVPAAAESAALGGVGASHYFRPGATLGSGDTETGVWGDGLDAAGAGDYYSFTSFPVPLRAALDPGHAVLVATGSAPHCAGPGHADSGYLCVYVLNSTNGSALGLSNPEVANGPQGSGARGFGVTIGAPSSGPSVVSGSFAVGG